jgi:hypothetical protein
VAGRADPKEVFKRGLGAINAEPLLRARKRPLRAPVNEKVAAAPVGSKRQWSARGRGER